VFNVDTQAFTIDTSSALDKEFNMKLDYSDPGQPSCAIFNEEPYL